MTSNYPPASKGPLFVYPKGRSGAMTGNIIGVEDFTAKQHAEKDTIAFSVLTPKSPRQIATTGVPS